jgi:hypothetical protein
VAVRRMIEWAVMQDPDGVWRRHEVVSVARFRLRAVSDRSRAKTHQRGAGVDFELVVDGNLGVWLRSFGHEGSLRRDVDHDGVSLVVVEDVTLGIQHELSYSSRPSDDLVRWMCTCNAGSRGWVERPTAEQQAEGHRARAIARDAAAVAEAQRRLIAREGEG